MVFSRFRFSACLCGTLALLASGMAVPQAETDSDGPASTAFKGWDMSVPEPVLEEPLRYEISAAWPTTKVDDFDHLGCEGLIYSVDIPTDRDARVVMKDGAKPLEYPLWIFGGRNVHVLGMDMQPVVQAGCDVGEAHQYREPDQPNIHPRLPGGRVMRLQQKGTTFIEGVSIDLNGMEGDCFVSRNAEGMTASEVRSQRHFIMVNTRCTGIEGLDKSPVGDGIHGDLFQNQGKDDVASLVLENVTYLTSSNGITMHLWTGKKNRPKLFRMRNVNYGWDPRFDDDDPYELSGLAFVAYGDRYEFDNVWLNHGKGANYGIFNNQRIGAVYKPGHIEKVDNVFEGEPETGDFAPVDKVGLKYRSPF